MQSSLSPLQSVLTGLDAALCRRVEEYTRLDSDYWSFKGNAAREHSHGYFQYPAMMVPEMISNLIGTIVEVKPTTTGLYDPFAGSGTVLTEGMRQGLDCLARDINPLAVLLCKVKKGPFFPDATREKVQELLARIDNDRKQCVEVTFPGRDKWFNVEASIELSRVRRAIQAEPAIWARRFFWIALAETVRTNSNSRTSTFKLHIRSAEERASRMPRPIATFASVLQHNVASLIALTRELRHTSHLHRGHYKGRADVQLLDAKVAKPNRGRLYDLLVTSPPYGDNVTTVPYGQHAYLPLQWIELSDIDQAVSSDCLKSTHEIDSRSLGGHRRDSLKKTLELRDISRSFAAAVDALKDEPVDRRTRVAGFVRDLYAALNPTLSLMKRNSYLIWTVGNRQVAQRPVPLDAILTELLNSSSVVRVTTIPRAIPTKRMALKNSISATMDTEAILVFRKTRD